MVGVNQIKVYFSNRKSKNEKNKPTSDRKKQKNNFDQ